MVKVFESAELILYGAVGVLLIVIAVVALAAEVEGIATFAIPIAIVGAGFMEAFDERRGKHHADGDPIQLLRELAKLKDEGAITGAQYEDKQKEVLARL